MYSDWLEAFAVLNKRAQTIPHLLTHEVFPRFGTPLQLVTDNGTDDINKVI